MDTNPNSENIEPTLSAKVAFLSSAETYANVRSVEVRETRMAWVFLAGGRVFKFKKPVQLSHLNYSTLAERHRICREEVRLNRRIAPDVYLGVAKLTLETDGSLAINGPGRVVEWLVEMRRLPDALFLDNAIRAGSVEPEDILAVGDQLAAFFRAARPVNVDPDRHFSAYLLELGKNRDIFLEHAFKTVGVRGLEIIAQLENLLNKSPEIVMDRVSAGHIIDGHGDLRPEHVHLSDPPIIIDCLEFLRALRLLDPFEELAYLSMECAVLGAHWIGPLLIDHCSDALGNRPSEKQLAFYTAFRATLRARQALAHLLVRKPRTPERWIPLARAYLDEAEKAMVTLGLPVSPPTTYPREGRE